MIFGINKNDSTSKTAAKAGTAGAVAGAGAVALSKIRPTFKEAFNSSIKQQEGYIKKFDNYVSTAKGLEKLTPLEKINKYIGGRLKTANDLSSRSIYNTFNSFKTKINAQTEEEAKEAIKNQRKNYAQCADDIMEKGIKNTIKEIGEERTVLMNGKPSKYIAGKKAIAKTCSKIGSKFEKIGDAIRDFIKSDSKKTFLKENKGKIIGGLKKYGLPIIATAAITTTAAIITKTILNKKQAKNEK